MFRKEFYLNGEASFEVLTVPMYAMARDKKGVVTYYIDGDVVEEPTDFHKLMFIQNPAASSSRNEP